MITDTPDTAKDLLVATIRNEAQAAYKRGKRSKERRYFIRKHRRGYPIAYRRTVVCFKDEQRFYPTTYCLDRRGNVYSGCDAMFRVTMTEHFSGFDAQDVERQMEIDRAHRCGYQQLGLAEKEPKELDQLLGMIVDFAR